ncbi:MAG: U32 family peptidase [Clostridiales bacterium]|jgi:putative protease|nr:U32 family peptidase [Clostridiales bacterium]
MSIELLSPAGGEVCLKAAIANGCDAVYFGGKDFNARRAANNFTDGEIEQMIDYCHLRGVKAYIVINTVYYTNEIKAVLNFAEKAYRFGADAFIVCDMGLISVLSKYFRGIALHASTQMGAHSLCDVLYLESIGISRVNIAREVPLGQSEKNADTLPVPKRILENGAAHETYCRIENDTASKPYRSLEADTARYIAEIAPCEIEIFAHGALCVCFSGRCLMSAFFGGRSGNRGDCAQPCRQMYSLLSPDGEAVKTGYLLSPRDLCAIRRIPEIMVSGVSSIKIEGRMKSPEYCAVTTNAYRAAINAAEKDEKGENTATGNAPFDAASYEKSLLQVFNRGGSFTEGYAETHSGFSMMSINSPKSAGITAGQVLNYDAKKEICTVLLTEDVVPGDGIEISGSGTYISKEASAGAIIKLNISGNIKNGDMMHKTYGKTVMDSAKKSFEKDTRKLAITGRITAKKSEPLSVTLEYNGISVTERGDVPSFATSKPVSPEEIISRFSKTGDTPFSVNFTYTDIEDDLFIPVAEINRLKRNAVNIFTEKYLESFKREIPKYELKKKESLSAKAESLAGAKKLTILVSDESQLKEALNFSPSIIYAEAERGILEKLPEYAALFRQRGVKLYIALAHLTVSTEKTEKFIAELEQTEIDGYLVRTLGQLHILSGSEKEIVLDYTFNITNPYAASAYGAGEFAITLSAEVDINEAANFGSYAEVIVYGKFPMMVTRQCPVGNYAGRDNAANGPFCSKKGHGQNYSLSDRKDSRLTIKCNCEDCYALIYSQKTLNREEFANASRLRLQFTTEDAKRVRKVINTWLNCL